ncbi:MAG: hypothetical protein U0Z53_18845 [Blastocatellia bacterium]
MTVRTGIILAGLLLVVWYIDAATLAARTLGAQCPPGVYCPPKTPTTTKPKPTRAPKKPPKSKPTPKATPTPAPTVGAHYPQQTLTLPFNPTESGSLDVKTAGLQIIESAPGVKSYIHYQDYALKTPPNAQFSLQFAAAAPECEVLLFELKNSDQKSFDQRNPETPLVPLRRVSASEFLPAPPGGVLPASGSFLVRVQYSTSKVKPEPIAYALRARKLQPGIDDLTEGTIHWQTSRQSQNPAVAGALTYADDYLVTLSKSDRVMLQFMPEDAKTAGYFSVRLYDPQNNQELPLIREAQGQDYQVTRSGVVTRTGPYRLSVQFNSADARQQQVRYKFAFRHKGLSSIGYRERMAQIINSWLDNTDNRNVVRAVEELNKLKAQEPNEPAAYEYLGRIYFNDLKDYGRAEELMRQALERGGQVSFRVRYDLNQIRKPGNKPVEVGKWKTPRTGELEIKNGEVRLSETDGQKQPLLVLTPQMISGTGVEASAQIAIRQAGGKNICYIVPERQVSLESELIRRLIDRYGRNLPSTTQ